MSQLNIFKIRQDIKTPEQILAHIERPQRIQLVLSDEGQDPGVAVTLFFENRLSDRPKWADFFRGFDLSALPMVSSCPAVLLVPVDGHIFALAFSHGASFLETDVYEQTFGLHVALNSISPSRVRSYNKQSFDALFRQTREHAARETKLEAFGIDAERDLVRQVTGKPQDPTLGSSMTGGSSLAVTSKIKPSGLIHYLRRLSRAWNQPLSGEYAWLGQIKEIRDGELKKVLDSYLPRRKDDKPVGEYLASGAGCNRCGLLYRWRIPIHPAKQMFIDLPGYRLYISKRVDGRLSIDHCRFPSTT